MLCVISECQYLRVFFSFPFSPLLLLFGCPCVCDVDSSLFLWFALASSNPGVGRKVRAFFLFYF